MNPVSDDARLFVFVQAIPGDGVDPIDGEISILSDLHGWAKVEILKLALEVAEGDLLEEQ